MYRSPPEDAFWLTMECEWVPDGVEPSIDEEVRRSYDGWRLNGLEGMRHWLRDRITIIDLMATG